MTGTRMLELREAAVAWVMATLVLVEARSSKVPTEMGSNTAEVCPLKSSVGSRPPEVELGEICSGEELNGGTATGKLGVVRRTGPGVGAGEGEARMSSELDGGVILILLDV